MSSVKQEQPEYLNLKVKPETLLRLLQKHELHADELLCVNSRSKKLLSSLLLKTVILGSNCH
jgi:hypothetical protein